MPDYLDLSKQAYEASTTYVDANYRADWDYSLRAFRNEHASNSKYSSPEYAHRSRIFHPKTRSIIRKNEAAAAMALFSNMEVVATSAVNPDDPMSVAAAECKKALLDFRLTNTIPAFQIVMGGVQDAMTSGAVCSYQYWEYQVVNGQKRKDKPCIDLRPIENVRFDPGASWMDVVGTSPYFFDIIPMYVCDVRAMMANKDDKTGAPKWKKYDDGVILRARPDVIDSTRKSRLGLQQDPELESTGIKDFDIVWVMRWFMRDSQGADRTYYTLGIEELLTDDMPIDEVYFHGIRPYVVGYSILETHKAVKTSLPVLVKPLQQAVNQIGNSRFDNVQFVLNKRWLVARGRNVDTNSLVRNVAGAVTLVTDPKSDVIESNWPDVTSSSYVEHDRMNAEFDDLAGNFSPSTKVANNAINDTLGGSRMANQSAGVMTDYLLRTIIETWWEPVLRQISLLESHYETDEVVLRVCAQKAQLFKKYNLANVTEDLLLRDVMVNVNVAMGATDPGQRLQKFLFATQAAIQLRTQAPPGANVAEMTKEIYSNAGYRDGARFFSEQQDPRLIQAMRMIQQLQGALEGKKVEQQAALAETQMKLVSGEKIKAAELQIDAERIRGDLRIREAELLVQEKQLELEQLKLQIELRGADQEMQMEAVRMQHEIDAAAMKLQGEREKQQAESIKAAQEVEKSAIELEAARTEQRNESRIGEVADQVSASMSGVGSEIERIKQALSALGEMKGRMEHFEKGMGAVVGLLMQPKKKAVGFDLKKPDGKSTNSVIVKYDDGSTEEMPIGRVQ